MSIRLLAVLQTALLALLPAFSSARDLGQIGPVYPIAERDLLAHIDATLKAKEASGELAKLSEAMQKRAIDGIKVPRPVSGITRTALATTRYFDPSVTVATNIVDGQGRVLIPAGTRKNPLEVVSLTKKLLFFDGRDPDQVRYARRIVERLGLGVKPILVGGSYLDLMRDWNKPVYYDQKGTLVARLGILQVPALVSQEGPRLRIDEVLP